MSVIIQSVEKSESDKDDYPDQESTIAEQQVNDPIQIPIKDWIDPPPTRPNESWGSSIPEKPHGTIRIIKHNVRGLKYSTDGLSFGNVFSDIKNLQADISLLVEINLEWKQGVVLAVTQSAANAVFGTSRIFPSSSDM